jgi:outer membrane protein assembly factor BamB
MRLRAAILALSLALAACGSTAQHTAGAPKPAQPAPRQADRVLILANYDGAVSVRTATGAVAFRAPYGVAAPDSSTIVQAQPITTGTRVVASDPLTGVPRWSHDVAGTRRVRVVSPGARFVALVDGDISSASQPRASTMIGIATAKGTRELKLEGNFDPEAFSVDGRYLFALQFVPATNPTRYSVRRIDLRTTRVEAVPGRDGGDRRPMSGYSRTQLMSPDGHQLYTFYATTVPIHEGRDTYHAFVHVLNLAKGWAYCIDLDERIGASGTVNPGLAVSPDGSRLFVTDGVSNAIAAVDTTTLHVIRTRFSPELANADQPAVTASDGRTVFTRYGSALTAIDARTLTPDLRPALSVSGVTALHLDATGEAFYLLTQDGLLVADRRGRIVHRWPSPGDATSIDPAVTVPGSGAYRCAC